MDETYYYLLYYTAEYFSLPFIVKITLFLILLLLLLYITFLSRVVIISFRQYLEIRLTSRVRTKYEKTLVEVLQSESISVQEIRERFGRNRNTVPRKEVEKLTLLIIEVRNNLNIYNSQNYAGIIEVLELRRYWKRIIEKEALFASSVALKILGDLELESSELLTGINIQNKDKDIQKYARTVFFDVSSSDLWNTFDHDISSDFTSLDEIRIHRALRKKASLRPLPPLMRWVQRSNNEDFRTFLVKEISFFKQRESTQALMKLLKETSGIKLKIQIVTTLGDLGCKEAIPLLCSEFHYNSIKVQQAVIRALSAIGTEKSLNFLEFEYHHCKNQDLLIDLVRGIYDIDDKQKTGTYHQLKSAAESLFTTSIFSFVEREKLVLS